MSKIFISADIEGTTGINVWPETEPPNDYFRKQMTREVSAAANSAFLNGATDIVIKDAHDSARNLIPDELPRKIRLVRGWMSDPDCMMQGLDKSFDACIFTGYHSPAGNNGNPLSHTMTTSVFLVTINGKPAAEFHINALIAARLGIPVICVTGDAALCDLVHEFNPNIQTVAVNRGNGNGVESMHPLDACEAIKEAVAKAMKGDIKKCLPKMPKKFEIAITYREHHAARRYSFYPGAEQVDSRTILYKTADYYEAMRFMHFCL